MAEKDQIDVKVTEKEEEEIEKNVVDGKMEGKESDESEKATVEATDNPQKKESTLDRFFGWFRGKPKQKAIAEENEDVNERGNEKENENKKNEEIIGKERSDNETNKEVNKEMEKAEKEIENFTMKDNQVKNESGTVPTKETKPVSGDRSLLIIEEEGRNDDRSAPLAEAEEEDEEDLEEIPNSRKVIDRTVIEPKRADAVEAERETTVKEALPQDDIDAKAEKRKSATIFLNLSRPGFERPSEEGTDRTDKVPSEHDEQNSKDNKRLVDEQQEVPQDNKQESKMEDVIEEKRQDARTVTMQETWKKVEELEPNKTVRVSYTMTTTTIEKSGKPEAAKPADDDDDDERLFGDDVLLSSSEKSSRPKYEGPPPEDLEPELSCEEAKKDESGSADIDKIFDMMAKDAPPPEGGVTVESTEQVESSQEIPQTPEEIFRKLQNWDKEPTDWWTSTKKKRDYEEWMKPMKDGTIRRVIIPNVEIPYDACVRFVTDWKYREEWDKTFSEIKILKESKESKLIYCPVKKRDLAFETLDHKEIDPPSHVTTWKRRMVDREGQEIETSSQNTKALQLITHTCGIILRPSESGDQATYITILCQLEGQVDNALKNTYMAGHPKSWLRMLKKYYKKQQKGAQKKVVYL